MAARVAIVTGAAHERGMGAAIARALAADGYAVAVVDIENARSDLEARQAEIGEAGGRAVAVTADVTDPGQVIAAVEAVVSELGRPSVLVNNAGVGIGSASLLDNDEAVWATTLGVNVLGVNRFATAVIPHMRELGGGVIVNNASMAGLGGLPAMPAPYTVSKHAVIGLTKATALEFAPENIRCVAICPGSVKTQMHANVLQLFQDSLGMTLEEAEAHEAGEVPLGWSCEPEEVAGVVSFLASDAARYLTGITVPISGGMSRGL